MYCIKQMALIESSPGVHSKAQRIGNGELLGKSCNEAVGAGRVSRRESGNCEGNFFVRLS